VGFRHSSEAYRSPAGSPGRQAVLAALAFRACDNCGLCWPGMAWLEISTQMSDRSIQKALGELQAAGLLEIRRYGRGGRGVATEYIVLPRAPKFSTAPCADCAERMRNPEGRSGYRAAGAKTPKDVRGNGAPEQQKPRKSGAQNPEQASPHQSEASVRDQSSAESGLAPGRAGLSAGASDASPTPRDPNATPTMPPDATAQLDALGLLTRPKPD
jgi:hypothetical protein